MYHNKLKATITAVGKFLPEKRLTNSDLEKLVETNDKWIRTRTGIKERRIVEKGQASSFMAINAFNDLKNTLDYEEHGGTSLLGINGIVYKAHGSSKSKGIKNTFHSAYNSYKNNIIQDITNRMEKYSKKNQ